MSADANQFLRDYRNFILTVEKPKGSSWSGTLFHKTCAGGSCFETPIEMARLMEEICEEPSAPKAVMEDRCFVKSRVSQPETAKPIQNTRKCQEASAPCAAGLFKISLRHRYNASWQGWIERSGTNHKVVFQSFLELIEQIMMAFPEDEVSPDVFGQMLELVNGRGVSKVSKDGMQWYSVPGASYHIKVLFRKNHSWQGVVRWLEGKESMNFRSFLELAKLTNVPCAVEVECEELQLG